MHITFSSADQNLQLAERNILFQNAADSIFADDDIKPVACSKETLDEGIWCT